MAMCPRCKNQFPDYESAVCLFCFESTGTSRVGESDRQAILMGLAHLAVERPGWEYMLEQIAAKVGDPVSYDTVSKSHKPMMFTQFRRMHKMEVQGKDEENPVRRVNKIRR